MLLIGNQSLNCMFYFGFPVHVLMVKQDIAAEELFVVCMAGCAAIHATIIYLGVYPLFRIWPIQNLGDQIQMILRKEQKGRA